VPPNKLDVSDDDLACFENGLKIAVGLMFAIINFSSVYNFGDFPEASQ
jgi:hypothetical protein